MHKTVVAKALLSRGLIERVREGIGGHGTVWRITPAGRALA